MFVTRLIKLRVEDGRETEARREVREKMKMQMQMQMQMRPMQIKPLSQAIFAINNRPTLLPF